LKAEYRPGSRGMLHTIKSGRYRRKQRKGQEGEKTGKGEEIVMGANRNDSEGF